MIMQSTCEVASMVDQKTAKKYEDQLNKLYTLYHGRGGQMPNAGN